MYSQQQQQRLDAKTLLHGGDEKSTQFLSNEERFNKDFASYDKQKREEDKQKKDMLYEKRKIQTLEREQKKWGLMESQQDKEDQKRQFQAQVLGSGKRNANGLPFNPLTLEYEKSEEGDKLRKQDEQSQIRALVRANNLDTRANCGYNIISGEQRKGIEVPDKYQTDFNSKLQKHQEFYNIKAPNNPPQYLNQKKYFNEDVLNVFHGYPQDQIQNVYENEDQGVTYKQQGAAQQNFGIQQQEQYYQQQQQYQQYQPQQQQQQQQGQNNKYY